ncbi:MAG TPA: hypothetical protein VK503_06860 [Candidatus Bathyarchaeia archaeon]|nr:hypothetical protein [Candidatus Bathyarchaeia archaeon]
MSDRSVQEPPKQDAQDIRCTTCDSNSSLEFSKSEDPIVDSIPNENLVKNCSACGDQLEEEQAVVCNSCGTQQETFKIHYRPNWYGISLGLFIASFSLITLNGILFNLAYVFGVSLIVLALLPASVSPAKIRCRNCGQLFREKLGQCPHCTELP